MTYSVLLAALATIASVPRLFTLLHLWQLKEWRWDRLKEHLRMSGWMGQLFGWIDPLLFFALFVVGLLGFITHEYWVMGGFFLAIVLQGGKMFLRGQPMPKWTKKAMAIAAVSFVLTLLMALFIALNGREEELLVLFVVPFFEPIFIGLSWALWFPVDQFLKKRVMDRARVVRNTRDDLTVIAVAGSVGKTTTKELLSHIFGTLALSTPAHLNTEMGVAQWLTRELKIHTDTKILIVEMGAYRKGEIALLCSIAKPTIGIITAIGEDHLALFGSKTAIGEANGELFTSLPPEGLAIGNMDDAVIWELLKHAPCKTMSVGTGGHPDLGAYDIEETPTGVRFRARDTVFDVPLFGNHNVTNILLAIAAAEHVAIPLKTIAQKLTSFVPPKNTFNVREERGITILDDTYNTSPQSFRAALEWARVQPHAHKVLLTSGIIELGEEEARIHRELGIHASRIFEKAYFLNKNFVPSFAQGFQKETTLLPKNPAPLEPGTLLVCIGRMSEQKIRSLLP